MLCRNTHSDTGGFVANDENWKCVKCLNDKDRCLELGSEVSYCNHCFLNAVKLKFKAAITRRRVFKDEASKRVLVVLDGTRESAFLFRQIEDARKQINFKRLLMEPCFILIICSVDASEIRALEENLGVLRQVLSSTYFIIHLAAVFGELRVNDDSRCQGLQHLPKLIELSNSFRTASSREEMLRILKIRLLQNFSRFMGISKIMMSCNSDVLSRLMLNQLCLGRGGRVSTMTDVVEKTLRGTTFIRPLRDISSQEILIALRLEKVEHYVLSRSLDATPSSFYYAYEASVKGSVQQCTDAFLNLLERKGFKSTTSTILSAASKIHIRDGTVICAVCEYSFLGNGKLCYTCSEITKELPFPNIVHICIND